MTHAGLPPPQEVKVEHLMEAWEPGFLSADTDPPPDEDDDDDDEDEDEPPPLAYGLAYGLPPARANPLIPSCSSNIIAMLLNGFYPDSPATLFSKCS